ncbi:unnamed protein product [Adineta ricciae]|uniref:VWFA domain-containing protein n=1 Tax=Adineta ricciae TaxID=249248 RepID=A0A815ZA58_ADIRI|nr:unnamed protein product [Adineta ricciae]CAF1579923.1 unnamed protein product [Adineta ricciae]
MLEKFRLKKKPKSSSLENPTMRRNESQVSIASERWTRNPYIKQDHIERDDDSLITSDGVQESNRSNIMISPENRHLIRPSPESVSSILLPKTDDRLQDVILRNEIRKDFAKRLHELKNYEIILLCDDSGSMKTTVDRSNRTRWDELRDFAKIILDVGTIFDSSGVDIYFLNRKPALNVKDPNAVSKAFSDPPNGYTPLVPALRKIFQLPITRLNNDKKVLVFVATDGAPTNDDGEPNVDELKHLMNIERRIDTTFVSFLICTDDPICVGYLRDWDKMMTNVDVTDDYNTERENIEKLQEGNFTFTKGDYIVKALVGAIDKQIDDLNEKRVYF